MFYYLQAFDLMPFDDKIIQENPNQKQTPYKIVNKFTHTKKSWKLNRETKIDCLNSLHIKILLNK